MNILVHLKLINDMKKPQFWISHEDTLCIIHFLFIKSSLD